MVDVIKKDYIFFDQYLQQVASQTLDVSVVEFVGK